MNSTKQRLFNVGIALRWSEGEVLHSAGTVLIPGPCHLNDNAMDRTRKDNLIERLTKLLLSCIIIAQRSMTRDIPVNDYVVLWRHLVDDGQYCFHCLANFRIFRVRCEEMYGFPLVFVFSGNIAPPISRKGLHVFEPANSVITQGDNLKHELAHDLVCAIKSAQKEPDKRLRALHQ